jgi:hypothetical protein
MALRNTFEIRHYGKGSRWRIPRILGKLQPIPKTCEGGVTVAFIGATSNHLRPTTSVFSRPSLPPARCEECGIGFLSEKSSL